MLCDPSFLGSVITEGERVIIDDRLDPAMKLQDRDIQRHIRQEVQDQRRTLFESVLRIASSTTSATGSSCAGWVARGPHQISRSPLREKKPTPVRRLLHKSFNMFRPTLSGTRRLIEASTATIVWTPYTGSSTIGVGVAIRKVGSSVAQGPDGLTVLPIRRLGDHGLAFLTELLNLSVAGVEIPAIWKNSIIIKILKAGRALPGSEDIGAAPPPVHSGCTRPSQYGFKLRHSTTSACSPFLLGWSLTSTSEQ